VAAAYVVGSGCRDAPTSGILQRGERGQAVADVCRETGSRNASSSCWKVHDGGVEGNQVWRLRQLQDEHR
jgi:hypothetical protein